MIYIAGPTEPAGEKAYKIKINNLVRAMKDKVVFLGNLNQEALTSFYKAIDILVLPSVNSTEAFGLVQVEAMINGTPVVASDLPGVRIPILKTGMGELAKTKDSKSLAEAICKVFETKYRNTVENIFNLRISYEKYRSVILSI